jgi:hypothetical protein
MRCGAVIGVGGCSEVKSGKNTARPVCAKCGTNNTPRFRISVDNMLFMFNSDVLWSFLVANPKQEN